MLAKWAKKLTLIFALVISTVAFGALLFAWFLLSNPYPTDETARLTTRELAIQSNIPELAKRATAVIEITHANKLLMHVLVMDDGAVNGVLLPQDVDSLKFSVVVEVMKKFPDRLHEVKVFNLSCKKDEAPVYY